MPQDNALDTLLHRRDRLQFGTKPHDEALATVFAEIIEHPATPNRSGVSIAELSFELAECRANVGDLEGAIAAMERCVELGYDCHPDARCDLAEYHLRAGRPDRARDLYDAVHRDTPDDIWLYNSAAFVYHAAAQHATALEWCEAGIDLALATDDPEDVLAQLADCRSDIRTALGLEPRDDLDDRIDERLHDLRKRAGVGSGVGDVILREQARDDSGVGDAIIDRDRRRVSAALAAFRVDEYAAACERWPELAERWPPSDPEGYCRDVEATLHEMRGDGVPVRAVVPIRVDEYVAWCAAHTLEPHQPQARSEYAASRHEVGRSTPWPPGRNTPCCCGSGRKYKKCCSSPVR